MRSVNSAMEASTNPTGLPLARAITVFSLVVLFVGGILTLTASNGDSKPAPSTDPCVAIRGIPGPEDLEVEGRLPNARRLLISSQDRRASPLPQGAIFSLSEGDERPRRLPLLGRDGCSFHPHGMSLVVHEGTPYLYVINHHDPADVGAGAGCLPSGKWKAKVSSVEVFRVEREALHFLTRLADPEKLTNPNDLVALPDGTVWVTNPADGLAAVREGLLRRNVTSRLALFTCSPTSEEPGCQGTWKKGRRFGTYLNGIAERNGGQELFVTSTAEGKIYRLDAASARGESASEPETLTKVAGADNLSWADADRTQLLVAGHPDVRQYLQHSASAKAPSPSQLTAVEVATGRTEVLFADGGSRLSGSSVGVRAGEVWYLGQVFEPYLLRCSTLGGHQP